MIVDSLLQEGCKAAPWGPPCLPEGDLSLHPLEWLFIAFCLLAFLVLVLFLNETFSKPIRYRKLTLPNARASAERISGALQALELLQGDGLRVVCREIANDLLLIADFTSIGARRFEFTHCKVPADGEVLPAIQAVYDEADSLRNSLVRALFLLKFRSRAAEGQTLMLNATSGYVSVLAPALRELHSQRTDARDRIPIFEINLPNHCQT